MNDFMSAFVKEGEVLHSIHHMGGVDAHMSICSSSITNDVPPLTIRRPSRVNRDSLLIEVTSIETSTSSKY